ncbi:MULTISPECIES: thiazolylpeptide-type bacteriocin [Streptomyces]|uniref:thiazolylpeptide-type bacteriocin n=1 Tax=Streptomyces TaxID=1883 RepID=UPI000AFFE64E|nr:MULTISPECIES: thiazolylpeptide-type bacteriocin [Streptomyces]MCH0559362.1 thiazolylpeptide-type bacteriocin [Streptomyces sp. MUM 16J]
MSTLANETPAGDLFASFDIAELEVLEVSDSVGLPEMGASSSSMSVAAESTSASLCCSSSSSTCCCC